MSLYDIKDVYKTIPNVVLALIFLNLAAFWMNTDGACHLLLSELHFSDPKANSRFFKCLM